MSKSHFLLALGLGCLLLLSSCGGNAESSDAATNATGSEAPAPAPAPANQADDAGAEQTLVGTFIGIEYGDYAHFMVKDEQGGEHSYFISASISQEQIQKFEGNEMKGKKVQVKWRAATADIPEAGGKIDIEEVTEITEL